MSVTLHHISPDWTLRNFIWSTSEYNLDDHTAANIGKFYLENVPDAPFRLVAPFRLRSKKHLVQQKSLISLNSFTRYAAFLSRLAAIT